MGFKNVVDNNPIFDTSQLNKAFSHTMANLECNELNNNKGSFLTDRNSTSNLLKDQ